MKQQSERMVASGFALALLVLGGVATGSYLSVQKLIASRQSVEHTFEVLEALNQISNGSNTIASGRYGYVTTGKKVYLSDYETGLQATERALQAARRLTSDNPSQQSRLTAVERVLAARLTVAQQSIALLEQGQSNNARQLALSNQSLPLAQNVQFLLTMMKDEERRLLQQRKAATDDSVQQAIVINGVGYLLGFSLLIGVFLLLHRQIRIRYQAEAALQKHSEEVYDLYNHAPCGYHSLDAAGTFIRINDTELDWLGCARDEVIHKRKFIDLLTPQSALIFQENFLKFKQQGWVSDVEFEIARQDGTLLPVSLSATAIKDGEGNFLMSRSTLFDISDRKRAQAALQEANEQLEARVQERTAALSGVNALLHSELIDRKQAERALLESEKQLRTITNALPVLISYVDAERRYRFNNQAYEQWFGYDSTTLYGKHLSEVLGESAYQAIEPYVEAALAGQEMLYESSVPYKDGGTRWVRAIYIPDFSEQGAVKGYFALISDVTDRKQAELALQHMNEALELKVQERTMALNQLNEDLVRSNQELEQFAYVASHDLQEPLRAVMGYTQLLVQDYQVHFDASAHQYAEYIVDGAKRMQQLIQDLLHYSRIGTRDLAFAPIDCNAVFKQVLNQLQVAIAEKHAIITHDPLPTVTADSLQFAQLLQNLIGNAIKFCREEQPQVHVTAELKDNEWLFSVHDNGIGIKPRYLERIFEIFKRLHTRTEFPGTGIGLAICKKIIDRHGGRIWAESQPGTGTTFYFTLPYHDHSDVRLDRDFTD